MLNSDNSDLEKLKATEIEVLNFVDTVCQENNLTYYLAYGTLLGAVRHQGFIPWDDDIDIMMPRSSYDMFVKCVSDSDRYKTISFTDDENYMHAFMKIIDTQTALIEKNTETLKEYGVFVDIIPIDGCPNHTFSRKLYCKVYDMLVKLIGHGRRILHCSSAADQLKHLMGLFVRRTFAASLLHWMTTSFSFEKSNQVGVWVFGEEPMPKSIFEGVEFGTFEGKEYPMPMGYETFLTMHYGDYMKLPPVEERVSEHEFSIYDK